MIDAAPIHILLVEDDKELQDMYKRKLEFEHFIVKTAATGTDALQVVSSTQIQVILLDIMLPDGMNGFDVLEQLKANEETKDIPVIMMTNLDSEHDQALRMGAHAYFVKADTPLDTVIAEIKTITGIHW